MKGKILGQVVEWGLFSTLVLLCVLVIRQDVIRLQGLREVHQSRIVLHGREVGKSSIYTPGQPALSTFPKCLATFQLHTPLLDRDILIWNHFASRIPVGSDCQLVGICDTDQCVNLLIARGPGSLHFTALSYADYLTALVVARSDQSGYALVSDRHAQIRYRMPWPESESSTKDFMGAILALRN